jgi:ABC-type uncharacterized transport system ATPase subunit
MAGDIPPRLVHSLIMWCLGIKIIFNYMLFEVSNVVIEQLTILLRIRDVPGSNFRRRSANLTEVFVVLLSLSRQMSG